MFRTIAATLVTCAAAATLSAQTPATSKSTVAPAPKASMTAKPVAKAQKETQASLRKEAKISEKTARATALKEVPNGKVRSHELERENGNLVWSYDIKVPGKSGIEEITVNAVTGAVVTHEHEKK